MYCYGYSTLNKIAQTEQGKKFTYSHLMPNIQAQIIDAINIDI